MAQPAVPVNEDRTDLLGIPPFWAKPSINPPFLWESWIGQFFLAVGLKDNLNPQDVLTEPVEVIDEPPPKAETAGATETAAETDARLLRDQAAIRRVNDFNTERRRKGPRIGLNWFYHEAEARLKSRLFFALGNEGKRRFADSYPHTDISVTSFRDFHQACEVLFKIERDYTVERIKLYNNTFMMENDTFSSFYARLSAQIALCNWPRAQERDTLKDLFIGRIRDVEVQQQLIKAKANLEDTFQLALECEKGASTSAQFQKLLPHNQVTGIKVKQEPTFSIQSSRGKRNTPQNNYNRQNTQSNKSNKACYFCGNPFSLEHRKSCPAREVTCNLCEKRGHFAKCCNSSRRRVNLVDDSEAVTDPSIDCNFIDADYDSEPEYSVLQLESAVQINSIELLRSNKGKPRSLSIQLRTGLSFFYSTIDTGSPVSFIKKRTCDLILQRNPSFQFRDVARYPIDTLYVDYNKKPIRLLGSVCLPISSSGWKVEEACFLVSENRTRNLLGLDLQDQLGVVTTQLRAEHVQQLEVQSQDPISDYWSSFFAKKYAHVFNRLGRSKNHKVFTNFKYPLVPRQVKGRKVPIHIQDRVAKEIKQLVKQGHIEKLDKCTTDYFIAPIVLTAKNDGSIKLALNAKPMNAQIWKNKYQMPNIHKLVDSVAQIITEDVPGTVWFTSLDLKYAFSQLPLSSFTSSHCNFNILCGDATGTYRFKTGFYGLTDMPTEFQKAMDCTLQGLEGVICYLDDILVVTKGDVQDHNNLVERVMQRLDAEGWALKFSKCEFSVNQLTWLGYVINEHGYSPKFSKIDAVRSLKPPKTLKQLRLFMGTLNHLQRFLPDLHTYTVHFRESLKACNKQSFRWGEEQDNAFKSIINLLANIPNLFHYDSSKKSRVKCDASHNGLGACLE